MNGEIICVGTELLLGDIVNTNAQYLSTQLAALGINVYNQSVVGDNEARIKSALAEALTRSDVIIFTGGLGPTDDDLTKESIASYLSLTLVENAQSRLHIEEYFRRTGRTAVPGNYKQALAPKGAHIFKNDVGTAPGYAIEKNEHTIIILPGPPSEMQYMYSHYVKPYLAAKTHETIVSHNIHIFGEMESAIEEKVRQYTKLENPTTAPYAKEGEVRLRVTAKAANHTAADSICQPIINSISSLIGDSVYGVDCENLQTVVVKLLMEKKLKIATAESCTAGMLSSMITEVPGSSEVFDFGISAYANRIKTEALGVPESVIKRHGAVSEHTAAYMALGVRKLSGADIGIGITGVAGPGASEHKPVGLVYIALADKENIWVRKTTLGHGSDEREKVRRNSAKMALDLVRRYVCSLPKVMPGGFKIGGVPSVLEAQPAIAGAAKVETATEQKTVVSTGNAVNSLSDREIAELIKSVANSDYSGGGDYYTTTSKEQSDEFLSKPIETDEKEKSGFLKGLFGFRNSYDTTTDAGGIVTDSSEEEETKEEPTEQKTDGRFMKFIKSVIPWKNDSIAEIIRKLIFVISFIVLIVSAVYMISYFGETNTHTSLVEETRSNYNEALLIKNSSGTYKSFDLLLQKNPDTLGWITIPNTPVDYPIVQCEDNDYYLTHDFSGNKSRYGTLFFDAANHITRQRTDQNLVIYGHEMRDGAMFGKLKSYKNVNFYKENPTFSMRTLYNDNKYKIFAIIITNASPEQDNGYVFNYRQGSFSSQIEFLEWTYDVKERSIINTGVDVKENDSVITLSTCTGEFEDARLVIFARKVRPGESDSIDLSKVSVNNQPHYPQAYYDKRGKENPFASSSKESSSDSPVADEPVSSQVQDVASDISSAPDTNASSDITESSDVSSQQSETPSQN